MDSFFVTNEQRRLEPQERRRVDRGGRRGADRSGRYPPILVADDYEAARQACARYLVHFHFDVLEAANGDEALAAITSHPPHVVLTDWMLPAMPASRLSQWLGESWRTRDIPLIVLADDAESASSHVAAAVLVKPFSMATMIAEIRRVLRAQAAASTP